MTGLTRRQRYSGPQRPESWQWSPTYQLSERRVLDADTEFQVKGVRGQWWHFVCHVVNPGKPAEWIDGINDRGYRRFRPAQITRTRKIRKRGVSQ